MAKRVPIQKTPFHERSPLLFLAIATAVALLPFLGKAFTMDDPLFLWAAQHIVESPGDPYGFNLNWYGRTQPMSFVMQNPPLTSYALALASEIVGWGEGALHFAFAFFAFAAVAGTWSLARGMTERPLLAAVLTLAMPFFLVSATNVMSDVPMVACFVWALALWRRGLDEHREWMLWLAALLAGAAGFFKYFGIAAVPLMLVYAVMRRRIPYHLVLPVALFGAYELATHAITGAAQYVAVERTNPGAKTLLMLSFMGGGAIGLLFFAPLVVRRRWWWIPAAVVAAAITVVVVNGAPAQPVVFTIFVATGIGVFMLAAINVRRDADSILLLLWIAGTAIFAAYVNWTVNARSLLPMIPAVAILIARFVNANRNAILAATAATAAVGLLVAFADLQYANAQRDAARQLMNHYAGDGHRMWFEGHWGFQFYMQRAGAVPFGFDETLHGKDLLVTPSTNTLLLHDVQRPPHRVIEVVQIPLSVPAATVSNPMKAAFYSDYMGPLPYVFGTPPAETYTVRRLGR
ncbi:MAG TPA: glycosyltransferase family 39 protein [Thermoanaerobaculia bacterium]|jgi:4-amino-4-deoxy-L-arabinose transferase-like glycosyltransferase